MGKEKEDNRRQNQEVRIKGRTSGKVGRKNKGNRTEDMRGKKKGKTI